MRPRILDLFCGQGGAGTGYHRAGFDVVGVDVKPQPRYPFEFVKMDAMYLLDRMAQGFMVPRVGVRFDAIHASPPCQAYSSMKALPNARQDHPDFVAPVRDLLRSIGLPWVMENVPGAPMSNYFVLCGSMFGLKSGRGYLRRHRLFEAEPPFLFAPQCQHSGLAIGVYGHGSAGHFGQKMRTANAPEARELMGIDWATRDGMSQAIPPAYTEWIGRQLIANLAAAA